MPYDWLADQSLVGFSCFSCFASFLLPHSLHLLQPSLSVYLLRLSRPDLNATYLKRKMYRSLFLEHSQLSKYCCKYVQTDRLPRGQLRERLLHTQSCVLWQLSLQVFQVCAPVRGDAVGGENGWCGFSSGCGGQDDLFHEGRQAERCWCPCYTLIISSL